MGGCFQSLWQHHKSCNSCLKQIEELLQYICSSFSFCFKFHYAGFDLLVLFNRFINWAGGSSTEGPRNPKGLSVGPRKPRTGQTGGYFIEGPRRGPREFRIVGGLKRGPRGVFSPPDIFRSNSLEIMKLVVFLTPSVFVFKVFGFSFLAISEISLSTTSWARFTLITSCLSASILSSLYLSCH